METSATDPKRLQFGSNQRLQVKPSMCLLPRLILSLSWQQLLCAGNLLASGLNHQPVQASGTSAFHRLPSPLLRRQRRRRRQQNESKDFKSFQPLRNGENNDSRRIPSYLFLQNDDDDTDENTEKQDARPFHSSFVPMPNNSDDETMNDRPTTSNKQIGWAQIGTASLLVAGTTVGGGFLAVPTVVAPIGFVPSALALTGIWFYLAIGSLIVVESLLLYRGDDMNSNNTGSSNKNNLDGNNDTSTNKHVDESMPGLALVAESVFGKPGKYSIVFLLTSVIVATLVSQISRAGTLVVQSASGVVKIGYQASCALTGISVAALVFACRPAVTAKINAILAMLFVIMAVMLFGAGSSAADWSRLLTATTSISSASSNDIHGTMPIFISWLKNLPQAIPTFLQLLVYGEILSTVCQLLHYQIRPIRYAIWFGSFLPLCLEVGWAALGTALVPPATKGDPVDWLLSAAATSTSTMTRASSASSSWIVANRMAFLRGALFSLAVAAILTTIIGSYMALQSVIKDIMNIPLSKQQQQQQQQQQQIKTTREITDNDTTVRLNNANNKEKISTTRRKFAFFSACITSLPSVAIASISPDVFLQAIDFAGSYPVILLWGIAPPMIALKLRRRRQQLKERRNGSEDENHRNSNNNGNDNVDGRINDKNNNEKQQKEELVQLSMLPRWVLHGMLLLSWILFAMNAIPDIFLLIQRFRSNPLITI